MVTNIPRNLVPPFSGRKMETSAFPTMVAEVSLLLGGSEFLCITWLNFML